MYVVRCLVAVWSGFAELLASDGGKIGRGAGMRATLVLGVPHRLEGD